MNFFRKKSIFKKENQDNEWKLETEIGTKKSMEMKYESVTQTVKLTFNYFSN